jgi:hypothetical protein
MVSAYLKRDLRVGQETIHLQVPVGVKV